MLKLKEHNWTTQQESLYWLKRNDQLIKWLRAEYARMQNNRDIINVMNKKNDRT